MWEVTDAPRAPEESLNWTTGTHGWLRAFHKLRYLKDTKKLQDQNMEEK